MPSVYILCLIVAVVTIGAHRTYHWLLPKPLPGIAYNPKALSSVFGDGPSMLREIRETKEFGLWCARQVEQMGSPICQVFVRPLAKPWVLVSDFREAQDIMVRRREFDKSSFITDGMSCLGDFHPRFRTNDMFRRSRAWLQDLIAPTYLYGTVGPAIHAKGLNLVQLFDGKIGLAEGRPFSIKHDLERTSLDIMLWFLFGENMRHRALDPQVELITGLDALSIPKSDNVDKPVSFPEAELNEFLQIAYRVPQVVEDTVVAWIPRLSVWWWKKMKWFRDIFAIRDKVVREQVDIAVKNYYAGTVKSGIEHMMMREGTIAEKEGRQPDFRNSYMENEIFGEVMAGHHTTGGALGWTCKFLTANAEVQKKLREELYTAFPEALVEKRPPTFDEIRRARIPYLDAVPEETLRLTSVVVTREAMCDTQILGKLVPKGTQIFLLSNGPGFLSPSYAVDEADRHPTAREAKVRLWDETRDPKTYNPERWLVRRGDDEKDPAAVDFDANAGPQIGFGMGPRQCWGRRLAQMEIRVIITLLLWHFEFLEIPESLADFHGHDGVSRRPQRVYVRMKRVES